MKFLIGLMSIISLNAMAISHEHPTCCSMFHDCQSIAGPAPDCSSNCIQRHAVRADSLINDINYATERLKDLNNKLQVQIDRKKDFAANLPNLNNIITDLKEKSFYNNENLKHKNEKLIKLQNKVLQHNKTVSAKILHENYFDKNFYYKIAILLEEKDKNLLLPLNALLGKALNENNDVISGIDNKIKLGQIKENDFVDLLDNVESQNVNTQKQIIKDITLLTEAEKVNAVSLKQNQDDLANKDKVMADINSAIATYQNDSNTFATNKSNSINLRNVHLAFRDVYCKLKYIPRKNFKKICGRDILQNYTCIDSRPDLVDSDT